MLSMNNENIVNNTVITAVLLAVLCFFWIIPVQILYTSRNKSSLWIQFNNRNMKKKSITEFESNGRCSSFLSLLSLSMYDTLFKTACWIYNSIPIICSVVLIIILGISIFYFILVVSRHHVKCVLYIGRC